HTRARGAELPGAYGGDRRPLPVGGVAGVVRLTSARVDRRAGGSGAGGGDRELLLDHVVANTARGQPDPRGARREVLTSSYAALTRNAQRGLSPRSQHSCTGACTSSWTSASASLHALSWPRVMPARGQLYPCSRSVPHGSSCTSARPPSRVSTPAA